MPIEPPLVGQTILVSGASGAAVVEAIARDGAKPIIHDGRNRDAAEALRARAGGQGILISADLSEAAGPECLWSEALAAAGRIHGLVNNAGIRTTIGIEAGLDAWQAPCRRPRRARRPPRPPRSSRGTRLPVA